MNDERDQTCPACNRLHRLRWDAHLSVCDCGQRFDYAHTLFETRRWLRAEVAHLEGERDAAREVTGWAQAVLTALNVGDVQSESLLHKKLREVMIAYRAALAAAPPAPRELGHLPWCATRSAVCNCRQGTDEPDGVGAPAPGEEPTR